MINAVNYHACTICLGSGLIVQIMSLYSLKYNMTMMKSAIPGFSLNTVLSYYFQYKPNNYYLFCNKLKYYAALSSTVQNSHSINHMTTGKQTKLKKRYMDLVCWCVHSVVCHNCVYFYFLFLYVRSHLFICIHAFPLQFQSSSVCLMYVICFMFYVLHFKNSQQKVY